MLLVTHWPSATIGLNVSVYSNGPREGFSVLFPEPSEPQEEPDQRTSSPKEEDHCFEAADEGSTSKEARKVARGASGRGSPSPRRVQLELPGSMQTDEHDQLESEVPPQSTRREASESPVVRRGKKLSQNSDLIDVPVSSTPEGDRARGSNEHRARSGALVWHQSASITESIRSTFSESLEHAHEMVKFSPENPEKAVHSYRKTIRRLRALVKLLRDDLPSEAIRSIDTGLRSAVIPTSHLRDARVLLTALSGVPVAEGGKKLRRVLQDHWEADLVKLSASGEETRVLISSSMSLARLSGELDSSLPNEMSAEQLRMAIRRSYRRTRRAFHTATRVGEDAAIHRARKRIKELRYQLEWITTISKKRIERRRRTLSELAQDLGEVTDFLVLEEAILERRIELKGLRPRRFTRRLRERLLVRFDEIVVEADRFFSEKSRQFARGAAEKLG